ncbi:MAG: metalloregulator ArsR/SmtB family transcription factor [Rectinemataceae bacterium]
MNRKHPRDDGSVDRRVEILKALANPKRLNIVMYLSRGAATVSALAESLDIKPCIVSQQLGILRLSDIVQGLRDRGYVRYELIDPRVLGLIRDLDATKIRNAKPMLYGTKES